MIHRVAFAAVHMDEGRGEGYHIHGIDRHDPAVVFPDGTQIHFDETNISLLREMLDAAIYVGTEKNQNRESALRNESDSRRILPTEESNKGLQSEPKASDIPF